MIPAMALSLCACRKNEQPKPPKTPTVEQTAVQASPAVPPVPSPALNPDERAAKLGFVKHLPLDTEVVMAFHNGSKTAERIQASELWKLVQSEMGMIMEPGADEEMEEDFEIPEVEQNAEIDLTDTIPDAEPAGPAALFATEFTIALGKTGGNQTANLLTLNRRMSYFQMRLLTKTLAHASTNGDLSAMASGLDTSYSEIFTELLADPESGVGLIEKMNMPPLYLAFRTSPSGRDAAAQQIASLTENLAMLGDMVEPAEVEIAGQTFAGHRISGAKISAFLAEQREQMDSVLEPADIDRLLAAIAKKDLVVLSGTLGDYVVLFIGGSVDDLKFAPDISQSLVSSDALAFCDAYAAKELAAVIYGQRDALDQITRATGGIADMAAGLRDGLAGTEALGDTRDLETLLRMVGEREAALRALAGNEALGMAAFFEDGLKIESFGGTDNGMIDWNAPNKMAALGDSQDVVMFANMTTDAIYDAKARDYIEALLETAYALAVKISEVPAGAGEMADYQEMAKMFDTKFRPDLVAMWDAFSEDFGGSLGGERAWVMDLQGTVPAIPGIPKALIDEGKFPRLSVVAPVADRAKLAASWDTMNTSLASVLAKAGEVAGKDIPMQKPISSEKNGHTTWFFSLPFLSDDFMPSVTVGDQWFAASTSKNQALDLVSQAAASQETRSGFLFAMNFKALEKFSEQTLAVLAKDPAALGMESSDLEDARKAIKVLHDLDKLTIHARREAGVLRSSVHLKTR